MAVRSYGQAAELCCQGQTPNQHTADTGRALNGTLRLDRYREGAESQEGCVQLFTGEELHNLFELIFSFYSKQEFFRDLM